MTRGAVTLVFDDGYQHILDEVVPALDNFGLPGVFAIATQPENIMATEGLPTAPISAWLPLQKHGHEIASHTVSHRDLTKLSLAELDQELSLSQQPLHASTLVYPGGAFNDTVIAATRTYYSAGRTTVFGFESLHSTNPWQLKTYNFTRTNWSLFKANILALYAYLTNTWFIETYHIITDQPNSKTHSVPLSEFKKHLRFLSQLPIKPTTISRQIANH